MDPLHNIPRLSELWGHLLCLPTADRGTFTTLTSVQDIQAWTTAKADEYRRFALALLAIHNLAAPIHRLPTEVLERILELCWQDWNSLRLPHVCRLWRSILLDRPAFWADAVADCEFSGKREVVRNELPLINALLSRSTRRSCTIKPSFYTLSPSVTEAMTSYVSNVVSLQVAVGRGDLLDRLWPTLVSGIPNLEALVIQLTITEEDMAAYNERADGNLTKYHCKVWDRLSMLSRKALPKLSRLTCPPNMIGFFGDVSLRHVRVEWIDRSPQHSLSNPVTTLGELGGLHLEPFCDCLETLEIMPAWFDQRSPSEPQELPFLRYLRIEVDASLLLSWLILPQTAFIHIVSKSFDHIDGDELYSIVSTIDRVYLQEKGEGEWGTVYYFMQCFTGNAESLRIDNFGALNTISQSFSFRTLVPVFGTKAPVTHLVLSLTSPTLVKAGINLHAFPHLMHLDVSGSHIDTIAFMLEPDLFPWHRRPGQAVEPSTAVCVRLKELKIICQSLVPSAYPGQPEALPDSEANLDELFHNECAFLQQALADRASRGTPLTYLSLSLRLPTIRSNEHKLSDSACGTRTAVICGGLESDRISGSDETSDDAQDRQVRRDKAELHRKKVHSGEAPGSGKRSCRFETP